MKIATLAYQRHENVGAVLQCYALQKTITSYGHKCEVIDYVCDPADRIFGYQSFKVKGIKKYITSCIGVISRLPKKPAFISFRKNILETTKKYDKRNISELDGVYDGYIVGSDNVWNSKLTGLDGAYFFDFVTDDRKKASYAASMGLAAVPEDERDTFREGIKNFSYISLRERAAAEDIGKLLGRETFDTCDPTIFLTREEWDGLVIEPKIKRPYVLVYHMSPSASFVKFASDFAKSKGLPIVYVPFPYGFCKCSPKPHIGPCEWLGYIKNASYVVTDSFHGCVFSSIYERNLIIKVSQLGERIKNLTEKLGIQDRMVTDIRQAIALPDMAFADVRERISDYRKEGMANLKNILDGFANIK